METDDATSMAHTLWRKQDNFSGRWTSPDPYAGSMTIADPQTFNRYTYCNNDPVNLVDPTGLALSDIGVYQTDNPAVARELENEMVRRVNVIMNQHQQPQLPKPLASPISSANPDFGPGPIPDQSTSPTGPLVDPAELGPPPPTQAQQAALNQVNQDYPPFTSGQLATVNQAINNAGAMVITVPCSQALNGFGNADPTLALNGLRTTGGVAAISGASGTYGEIEMIANPQNIFPGAHSTAIVRTDYGVMPVSQYFVNHRDVDAIRDGENIFLGPGFFAATSHAQALDIIHERVVHVANGRLDTEFGQPRRVGSNALNNLLQPCRL